MAQDSSFLQRMEPATVRLLLRETVTNVTGATHTGDRPHPQGSDGFEDNPYKEAQGQFLIKGLNDNFGFHLRIIFALAALVAMLSLASLFLQWTRRHNHPRVYWFFRNHFHAQAASPYLVPHPVNIVLIATASTSITLIVYLTFSYRAWELGRNYLAVRIASWFPLVWFQFLVAIWLSGFGSLYLSILTPAQFTRRESLKGLIKHVTPGLINGLCFGVPVLACATLVPLQIEQSTHMNKTMRLSRTLYMQLEDMAMQWEKDANAVTQKSLATFLDTAQEFVRTKSIWSALWKAELSVWSFWTLLGTIVAVPFGLALVSSTHRRIRRMADTHVQQNRLSEENFNAVPSPMLMKEKYSNHPLCLMTATPSEQSLSKYQLDSPSAATVGEGCERTDDCSRNRPSPTPSGAPSILVTPIPTKPSLTFTNLKSNTGLQSPSTSQEATASPTPTTSTFGSLKSLSTSARPKFSTVTRMSSYALFPGKAEGMNSEVKADFRDLHKRYWYIAAQALTVLLVMIVICGFAVFEASVDDSLLIDCSKTNMAVIVVSYVFCVVASFWLVFNLHRLLTSNDRKEIVCPETPIPARRRSSAIAALKTYTLTDRMRRRTSYNVEAVDEDDEIVDFPRALQSGSHTPMTEFGLGIDMERDIRLSPAFRQSTASAPPRFADQEGELELQQNSQLQARTSVTDVPVLVHRPASS